MKNDYDQPDYAREALQHYHRAMPWLGLMTGVRQAMEQQPGRAA